MAAALAQKSVHYSQGAGYDLLGGIGVTADVTADSGTEREWSYDGSRAELRLVDGTVYVKGNRTALTGSVLDLTRAQAKKYAGHWISISRSDHAYAGMTDGLTLASAVRGALPFPAPIVGLRHGRALVGPEYPYRRLEVVRKKSHGTRLLVVQTKGGWGAGWARLSAHATGARLPIATSGFIGYGNSDTARFSRWNEPVNPHAPARSTPIAAVRA